MNSLISTLLSRWVLTGTALAFMAPVVQPFAKVSIPEHVSIKDFVLRDTSFKQAMQESRSESGKLFVKAKSSAGSIITKTLNNIK